MTVTTSVVAKFSRKSLTAMIDVDKIETTVDTLIDGCSIV